MSSIEMDIRELLRKRHSLERSLLKDCPRFRGSLLRRVHGKYVSWYVSQFVSPGKTKTYSLRKCDVDQARKLLFAWKKFLSTLSEWTSLNKELSPLFKRLGLEFQASASQLRRKEVG